MTINNIIYINAQLLNYLKIEQNINKSTTFTRTNLL